MILSSTKTAESAINTFVQGSVSAALLVFISETVVMMIPFFFAAIALIVVDLIFGIQSAKMRNERVTVSRGVRLTANKIMEYMCWIILSATLSEAFHFTALNWIILSVVMGNELISIITNYLELHGKKISGLNKALLGWIGKKSGIDTSEIKIEEFKKTDSIKDDGNDNKKL